MLSYNICQYSLTDIIWLKKIYLFKIFNLFLIAYSTVVKWLE
jgi:hypothetical protein